MALNTNESIAKEAAVLTAKAKELGATQSEIDAALGVTARTSRPSLESPSSYLADLRSNIPEATPEEENAEVSQEPTQAPFAFDFDQLKTPTPTDGGFAQSSGGGFAQTGKGGFAQDFQIKVEEKNTKVINAVLAKRDSLNLTARENNIIAAKDRLTQVQQEQAARIANNEDALVSDADMGTSWGKTLNLLSSVGITGMSLLSETLRSAPARISRQANKSGISREQFGLYDSAQNKNTRRVELDKVLDGLKAKPATPAVEQAITRVLAHLQSTRLTDEEAHLFSEESIEEGDIYQRKTIGDKIHIVREADEFIRHSEKAHETVSKLTNNKFTTRANNKLRKTLDEGVVEFSSGETLESIGTILGGFADLATEDTYAASQVFAESVPYMVALVAGGAVTLPVDAVTRYDKSVEAFTAEYGADPTGTEDHTMKLMAVVASLTDKLSAGATAKAGTITKNIIENSKKLNVRLPTVVKSSLIAVGAPIGSTIVEGATEGAQNILEQTAATLRDPKIDPVEVLTNVAHGSFGGGLFSAPSTVAAAVGATASAASKATKVVKKVASQVKEKVTEDIGEQTEPEAQINQIIREGLSGLDAKKRAAKIIELIKLNETVRDAAAEEGVTATTTETEKTIAALTEQHLEMVKQEETGKTTKEHITSLTEEDTPEQKVESDESVKVLAEDMSKRTSIPLGSAEKVFGSTAFTRASPKDQKIITEYIQVLKSMGEVSSEIREGTGKFKGLNVHLKDLDTAVLLENKAGAQSTINALVAFKNNQIAKIKAYEIAKATSKENNGETVLVNFGDTDGKYYEPGKTDNYINTLNKDLQAIETTIGKAQSVFKVNFNADSVVEPEAVTETPQAVEAEVAVEKVKGQVEDKAPKQTVLQQNVTKVSESLSVLGDKDNKLDPIYETRRKELHKELEAVKTKEELIEVRQSVKQFKAETRKSVDAGVIDEGIADTTGSKGSHRKTLSENILADTPNSISTKQIITKEFKKVIGNVAGATVATLFKLKGKPTGFFSIVHNFYSRYEKRGFTRAMQDKVGKISKEETEILDSLAQFNSSFSRRVNKLIPFIGGKRYFPESAKALSSMDQNPLLYLIKQGKDGKRYLPENVLGLMSTVSYSWLGTRARSTLYNLDKDINSILSRDTDTPITSQEAATFRMIGTTRTALAESLGAEVVKQLGLEVKEEVDGNMLDRLAMGIGLTMIAALAKDGYITQKPVSAKKMAAFIGAKGSTTIDTNSATQFIRLTGDVENNFRSPERVNVIADTLSESTDFLKRMFGIESFEKFTSLVPVSFVPKTLKGTTQEVSNKITSTIKHMQQVEWGVKSNVNSIAATVSRQSLLNMSGWQDTDNTKIHVKNIDSVTAKNEAIEREVDSYFKSLDQFDEGASLYFQYEPVKNMRIHIVGNMLNPQSSKVHRHLVGAKAWTVNVPVDDVNMRQNFQLAVAQAFGFGIDKNNLIASLDAFNDLLSNEVVQKGVEAVKRITDADISLEDKEQAQAEIEAAVAIGKENLHSLEGLVALSEYKVDSEFVSNIGLEVDGVTNGVAIGLLQSALEADTLAMLASTGLYVDGSQEDNFPDWKGNRANLDLYQTLAHHWVSNLNKLRSGGGEITGKINAIEALIGKFIDEDGVTDIARKMSKDPLMVTSYGSAVTTVVKALNAKFLSSVYTKLERTTTEAEVEGIVKQVYLIAGRAVPSDIDYTKPLEIEFDKVERALNETIKATYGKALKTSLQTQFKEFYRFRETLNTALNAMSVVFNIKYEEAFKAAETKKGKKLSKKEQQEVFKTVKAFLPTFEGPTSTGVADSISVIKTKKARDHKDKTSKVQVDFQDSPFDAKSASGTVSHTKYEEPGVSGLPVGTHAQDSSNQLPVLSKYDALNVFDAHINGIDLIDESTNLANESFWKTAKSYSILDSVNVSFLRVMRLIQHEPETQALVDKYLIELNEDTPDLTSFTQVLADLNVEVAGKRKEILEAKNVRVGQFAKGVDSIFTANQTTADIGLKELVDSSVDEALSEVFTQTSGETSQILVDKKTEHKPSKVQQTVSLIRSSVSKQLSSMIDTFEGKDAEEVKKQSKLIKNNLLKFLNNTRELVARSDEELNSEFKPDTNVINVQPSSAKTRDTIVVHELTHAATVYGFEEAVKEGNKDVLEFVELIENHKDKVLAKLNELNDAGKFDFFLAEKLMYVYNDNSEFAGKDPVAQKMYRAKEAIAIFGIEPEARAVWNEVLLEVDGENVKPILTKIGTLLKAIIRKVDQFISEALEDYIQREINADTDLGTVPSTALDSLYKTTLISMALNGQADPQAVLASKSDTKSVLEGLKNRPERPVSAKPTKTKQVVEADVIDDPDTEIPFDRVEGETTSTEPVYDERNPPPTDYGSSTEEIDFGNFPSRYDENLTAANSLQIFEDMDGEGNKRENVVHKAHLKEVLSNIVNTVLTATDSLDFRVGDTDTFTHGATKGEKVYINASAANRLNNNSEMSTQEVQVHELLHTVLAYAIDHDFHLRKQLIKLFDQVAGQVTWEDFLSKDVNGNTLYQIDRATEEAAAKARYNYIFNSSATTATEHVDPESGLITTSVSNAYLHEFVSFGLTNEVLKNKLATIGAAKRKSGKGLSVLKKLQVWYLNALDWISGKFYQTENVNADVALRNLANKLAGIHGKRRTQALRVLEFKRDLNDIASKKLNDKIIQPFVDWRNNQLNQPTNPVGKALNVIATIPLTYRNSEFRKTLKKVLRNLGVTEERMLVKLVREIQGTKGSNAKWHVLLRHSKHVIDNARKHIANEIIKNIRRDFVAGTPNEDEAKAITRALYKTDLGILVGKHTIGDLMGFLRSDDKLAKAVLDTKKELQVFGSNMNYYINQARGLGSLISKAKGMQDQQMMNAYTIANLTTTGKTVIGDVAVAEEIIDRLASLYALVETEADQKKLLAGVIKREYAENDSDNGIITLFNLQKGFKEDALDQLFKGNKTLMGKGYISESFNPNVDIKIATLAEEEELAKSGYVRGEKLTIDEGYDPNTDDKYMYVSKNNVGNTYLKSIASLTSRTVKGSTLLDGYRTTGSGTPTKDSIAAKNEVTTGKQRAVAKQFRDANAKAANTNTLVPILNEKGQISGYRYMMTEHQKVSLLERDDRFDVVMGNMWGSVVDKVNSKDVNRKVIELAHEDYLEGFTNDPDAYVRIAIDAPEQRYAELFSLLPEEVRRDMEDVWGSKEIYVKRELTDLIFGYRKASITNLFKDSEIPVLQDINKLLNKGSVKHIEAIWQELVSVAKTNIVIRNPAVLIGNFVSNLALSWVKGVPPIYMIQNQALALRALNSYQKDISKRDTLQRDLDTKPNLSPAKIAELKVQLARASDDVTNNPVRELVDEGIFQSIIEDIDDAKSTFNYRDRFLNSDRVKRVTKGIPDPIKQLGKQSVMTEDTTAFKTLMKATQYSDFIARFALHKHNTEVKGMDKQKSIADVVETFVNYDIPTSKQMQYLNDMGFFMFSKFLFRIQKVIFTILKDRPASSLSLLLMQNVFGDISDVADSNLITGSLLGRVNFIAGPLDSATDLKGLQNMAEVVGY